MLEDENTLYIYTDGSTYYKPRRGGVGILFVYSNEDGEERIHELDESGFKGGTIVEMEIKACTIALTEVARNELFSKYKNVVIYSDNQFVVDNFPRLYFWNKNGWKTKNNVPLVNTTAWKELLKAKKALNKPVEIHKVKAHSKNIYNKRADKLAKKSAGLPVKKPSQVVQVSRKLSPRYTEVGSVKMLGQVLRIHIIQRQYLPEHKIDRYRYEITNRDSKYFECVDFIFSEFHLKRNHFYDVRVNKDQNFPKVEEVLQDITQEERQKRVEQKNSSITKNAKF